MQALFNYYSFLWIAIALTLVAGLVLLSNRPGIRDFVSFGIIVAGLLVAWLVLRPQQTPLVGNAKAVEASIGAGTPVLLEFQSPY